MIVKKAERAERLGPALRALAGATRNLATGRVSGVLVLLLIVVVSFLLGGAAYRARWQIKHGPSVVANAVRGRLSSPTPVSLEMTYLDYQHLAYKRYLALQRGALFAEEDSFVPAKITVGAEKANANVRLKGEALDHVEEQAWSFRIRLRGDRALMGMRRFSLQSPARSGWIKEWLLYRFFEHEDLLALRYGYVNLAVNGKNWGVYAVEESFAAEFLDHNRRREGPLLKFDERVQVAPWLAANSGDYASQADIFFGADIIPFQTSRTIANPALRSGFLVARELLTGFVAGERSVEEVFDVDRAATTMALLDLLGAAHAIRWKNVRFYFNPITTRLELIGYNAYAGMYGLPSVERLQYETWRQGRLVYGVSEWQGRFFSDPAFLNTYFGALERLTAPGYLEAFLEKNGPELDRTLRLIHKTFPGAHLDLDEYFRNRDRVAQILAQSSTTITADVRASGVDSVVALANPLSIPIEPLAIRCDQGAETESVRLPPSVAHGFGGQGHQLAGIADSDAALFLDSCPPGRAQVEYRVVGTQPARTATLEPSGRTLGEMAALGDPTPEAW